MIESNKIKGKITWLNIFNHYFTTASNNSLQRHLPSYNELKLLHEGFI